MMKKNILLIAALLVMAVTLQGQASYVKSNRGLNKPMYINVPLNAVTSTQFTWLGEARTPITGQTGDYTTDFEVNNQHIALYITSLTGSGDITITGLAASESTGLLTAGETETITVDAASVYYQSDRKWIEVTNIDIPAGITAINYDIAVIGYVDFFNTDYEIIKMRVDMTSSGVNADCMIEILKVQDDGNKKMSLVTIEKYGIDGNINEYVDEVRSGGDSRDGVAVSSIWTSGKNGCLKVNDYSTYFTDNENVIYAASMHEGIVIRLIGTGGGNINNVSMINLLLIVKIL